MLNRHMPPDHPAQGIIAPIVVPTLPHGTPPAAIAAIEDAARAALDQHGPSAFVMPLNAALAHEAGHAIVASHEGLTVHSVKVFPHLRAMAGVEFWGGRCTAGGPWITGPDSSAEDDLHRARFIVAGLAGEAVTGQDKPGSSLDELVISQVIGINAAVKLDDDPGRSDDEHSAYVQGLWHKRVWGIAVGILRANPEPFVQIMQHLHQKGDLRGAKLHAILAQIRRVAS